MTIFLFVLLVAVSWRLYRIRPRQTMSRQYLADLERRSCGQGVDGVSWQWPVRREDL